MMAKSKVFFTDRNAEPWYNMLDKLEHVFAELGLPQAMRKGDRVMIKTHFGQWGEHELHSASIRPKGRRAGSGSRRSSIRS